MLIQHPFQIGYQFGRWAFQGVRELEQYRNRRVVNAAFYQADIVTLHISVMCKLLLSQSRFLTFLAQYLSES